MTRRKESTTAAIYSGTASFGRVMAVFGVVIGMIAGLVMIPMGIYFIVHKTKLTSTTTGTVSGVQGVNQCSNSRIENNHIMYDCNFNVKYEIGTLVPLSHTDYTINVTTTDSQEYKGGDNILVYYDPTNPSNGSITSDNTHIVGIILLILGIIIPTITWIWWYFTRKSKAVAAAGGVMAGLDLLSGGRYGDIL